MAAGEDQAKPVVGNLNLVIVGNLSGGSEAILNVRFDLLFETLLAADTVDGLVTGGLNDPCPRKVGNARLAPLNESGGKGVLCRFFGKVEITHEPDEDGDDSTPLRAIDCF